jgi:hypothetical protein
MKGGGGGKGEGEREGKRNSSDVVILFTLPHQLLPTWLVLAPMDNAIDQERHTQPMMDATPGKCRRDDIKQRPFIQYLSLSLTFSSSLPFFLFLLARVDQVDYLHAQQGHAHWPVSIQQAAIIPSAKPSRLLMVATLGKLWNNTHCCDFKGFQYLIWSSTNMNSACMLCPCICVMPIYSGWQMLWT